METIVSGVLFAIDNIADECCTWVPPDARWRRPRAYIDVYYMCVCIYIDIYNTYFETMVSISSDFRTYT